MTVTNIPLEYTMTFASPALHETDIHQLLSNPRRRATLEYLWQSPGPVTLRELSEVIGAVEAGESPPPRVVRERVYISLHQTHLPRLHDLGVVEYDSDRKTVTVLDPVRDVARYMDLTTRFGFTWVEYYRTLAIVALCLVVAALAEVPVVGLVDPLLWSSGFLLVFAASTTYQLWRSRHGIRRLFVP